MNYTLFIIIITALISYSAFNNQEIYNKLILWPKKMTSPNEYYRLLTSGFIHQDWPHLIFNMITLYFFGRFAEGIFTMYGQSSFVFVLLYLLGIIAASLPSFVKNRENAFYRSLGASGGVSAVLFAYIYYAPWEQIYIWFIPVPSIVAGVGYLIYSAYMSKKGGTNVNHDAHFWGAVFGVLFTFVFDPFHGRNFVDQLLHPHFF